MNKVIVKPYYKYKQEAYNKINRLGKSLLKEFDFNGRFSNSLEQENLILGYDRSQPFGSVSFCLSRKGTAPLWLFTLRPDFSLAKSSSLGGRTHLTAEETQEINRNLMTIFRTGTNSTVVKELNCPVDQFIVSRNECYFKSMSGDVYKNTNES